MLNSIFIIQSLLYIPEIYNFDLINLSQDNKYILDSQGKIIYGLCNLPEYILKKKIGINRCLDNRSISLSISFNESLVHYFSNIFYNYENYIPNHYLMENYYLINSSTPNNFKNYKYFPFSFKQLIKKKLRQRIFHNNLNYIFIKIGLNLSYEEEKKYKFSYKNYNNLYLRKLICYPDKYYDLNEILIKSITVNNFKSIIRLTKNSTNIIHKYLSDQINKFYDIEKKVTQCQCPICLKILELKDFSISICGHIFCYNCITNYIYHQSRNINKQTCCPICRRSILPNNVYKISNQNYFLQFENYNNFYLINKIGTKMTFILKFCNQYKNKKILIVSEFYSFLDKISKYLKIFNFNNILINNNNNLSNQRYLGHIFNWSDNINILLIHSNNLFVKDMIFNKLDYLFFSNKFYNKFKKSLFLKKLRIREDFNLTKVIEIKINNSIENS